MVKNRAANPSVICRVLFVFALDPTIHPKPYCKVLPVLFVFDVQFPQGEYASELATLQSMSREEVVAGLRRGSSGFSRGASRYRGVTRHHQHGKWEARIGRISGSKYLYLGTYETEEEAARAYDIAAIANRGARAVTNFPHATYKGEDGQMLLPVLPIGVSLGDGVGDCSMMEALAEAAGEGGDDEGLIAAAAGGSGGGAAASVVAALAGVMGDDMGYPSRVKLARRAKAEAGRKLKDAAEVLLNGDAEFEESGEEEVGSEEGSGEEEGSEDEEAAAKAQPQGPEQPRGTLVPRVTRGAVTRARASEHGVQLGSPALLSAQASLREPGSMRVSRLDSEALMQGDLAQLMGGGGGMDWAADGEDLVMGVQKLIWEGDRSLRTSDQSN